MEDAEDHEPVVFYDHNTLYELRFFYETGKRKGAENVQPEKDEDTRGRLTVIRGALKKSTMRSSGRVTLNMKSEVASPAVVKKEGRNNVDAPHESHVLSRVFSESDNSD